ncbi:hypothetical protein AB1Y20_016492 [Prymnesium parvum]|uniref:Kinesin-like protein n=1 Tax=Prymnesium parvum TaxID=97485 RepID=A0AB34I9V9_PRYPA
MIVLHVHHSEYRRSPLSPRRAASPRPASPRSARNDNAAPRSPRAKKPLAPPRRPPLPPRRKDDDPSDASAALAPLASPLPSPTPSSPAAARDAAGRDGAAEAAARVRVFVRVRPPVRSDEKAAEASGGRSAALLCQGAKLWLLDQSEGKPSSPRQFVFDQAISAEASQEDVYRCACEETGVVRGVLEGINGCVMCYGQTGAGKTFTLGNTSPPHEGLVYRALAAILEQSGGGREVRLSYVQIYNETIKDLLRPASVVELREEAPHGVVLAGCDVRQVSSVAQCLKLIDAANLNRATAATAMNDQSSRSHSVLVLDVTTKVGAKMLRGKLHLVDLAGSERVKKSEVTGQAFEETVAINNSLTCLGRCVQALAAGPKAGKPPFRETKLTRLLSSTFGGRANTVLVVCVAPTCSDSFETLNSLQFGQQAMSVKVQAKVNATVDMLALQDERFAKFYEAQRARGRAEAEAWRRVQPRYEAQQARRSLVDAEMQRVAALKMELQLAEESREAVRAEESAALQLKRQEHELNVKGLRQQQAAAAKELIRLRGLARAAGLELPEQAHISTEIDLLADSAGARRRDATASEASKFGKKRLAGAKMSAGQAEAAAMQAAGCGKSGAKDEELAKLEQGVEMYQSAVEKAWQDVQRIEDERQQVDRSYQVSQEEVERLDREREDMEATLHEVASDLGRLALLYRTQGQAPHAVPLYMTALAIYEKTLGPDHPEVAKDLVNLGNAFCDQNQHDEAVPLYLRALAIDQAALGDDHPEVAMDLSNLGIVYRVQGRRDEAIALFQRAQTIMTDALGPDDPKTLTVARNLAATQVIHVDVVESPRGPPAALVERLSQQKLPKTEQELAEELQQAQDNRDAVLRARVDKAVESQAPKLKLTLPSATSDATSGAATPRSTYKSTSKEARDAVEKSLDGGSARTMLHKHVASMAYFAPDT